DAKLGEMTAQRVDQHRSLADQKVAHLVQHQHGLLVDGLDGDKAHRRPGYRLRDRRGIRGISLTALHVWLDISRRHQSKRVPPLCQFPGPMMRGNASLHADQARRQQSEEPQHLSSAQLLVHQYLSCRINAVNLEDVLRKVQPDRGNLLHGRFPLMSSRSTTSSWHADAAAGPSTPSVW